MIPFQPFYLSSFCYFIICTYLKNRKEKDLSYPNPPAYRETRDSMRDARDTRNAMRENQEPHPYYYREKPTQYPRRDEPVEVKFYVIFLTVFIC
jgi:hypothetical protein